MHPLSPPGPRRPVVVIAHPGHELRIHGWLEEVRPVVHVLSDGSGPTGQGRLDAVRRTLAQIGAREGAVFGRVPDAELYAALLGRRFEPLDQLADELTNELVTADADAVVTDAAEGYNPAHEVCWLLARAAVRRLAWRGRSLSHFDFTLVARPDDCLFAHRPRAVWHRLDPAALGRKLAAAREYPGLSGDVDEALTRYGAGAFAVECLRPVDPAAATPPTPEPFYERHGARRVAAGRYQEVIRFLDHLAPLAAALRARRSPTAA
jgi:hypothetical protein